MNYKSLRILKEDPIAEVVLTGPGKGNAMGPDFWKEMPELFSSLDRDERVRAVLLRGEGNNFSYGLDLLAMMEDLGPLLLGENLAGSRTRLLDKIGQMQQACQKVAQCRKPVIAAIQGWCIGGGLDLISACDARFCSSDARFSLREVQLAIVADLGSLQRLPRIIGEGRARELAFTGKEIDAEEALRIGLVNRVYKTSEELLEGARQCVCEIAKNPPIAVQGIKQVMNACDGKTVEEGLRYVATWNAAFLQSLDLAEAFAAFAEKRQPQFKGE
ncbi:MAG: crotonase/enoyl-CoA hydratase family protein [Deltaproteobacteria bacterium]|nr:crotonase/enoyl-CoA hydratase family protein [Deltaproteobacteria bacterium]